MRKIIILMLAVFVILPSVAFANLEPPDETRWLYCTSAANSTFDVFIDKETIDVTTKENKYFNRKDHIMCTFWMNYYFTSGTKQILEKWVIDYTTHETAILKFIEYDSNNNVVDSGPFYNASFEEAAPVTIKEGVLQFLLGHIRYKVGITDYDSTGISQ